MWLLTIKAKAAIRSPATVVKTAQPTKGPSQPPLPVNELSLLGFRFCEFENILIRIRPSSAIYDYII
jgi:hypothetical protein